jgi:hypothetical protein
MRTYSAQIKNPRGRLQTSRINSRCYPHASLHPSGDQRLTLARSSDFWIIQRPRLPIRSANSDTVAGAVSSYSGGTVRDFHPLPLDQDFLCSEA